MGKLQFSIQFQFYKLFNLEIPKFVFILFLVEREREFSLLIESEIYLQYLRHYLLKKKNVKSHII